jgi:hypothetical protein
VKIKALEEGKLVPPVPFPPTFVTEAFSPVGLFWALKRIKSLFEASKSEKGVSVGGFDPLQLQKSPPDLEASETNFI